MRGGGDGRGVVGGEGGGVRSGRGGQFGDVFEGGGWGDEFAAEGMWEGMDVGEEAGEGELVGGRFLDFEERVGDLVRDDGDRVSFFGLLGRVELGERGEASRRMLYTCAALGAVVGR